MWPFNKNKRKWILVIGYSEPGNLITDIKCISENRCDCVNKGCSEIFDWLKHKKEDLGGQLIYKNLDLLCKSDNKEDDWFKFKPVFYRVLNHWTEEFQDTANLELTWKTSHLQICKISVRIFSSESDFIKF